MVNRIRTIYPSRLNNRLGLKFCVGSWVWHKTSEEGWRMHQPKHCEYKKDEDNSVDTLNNKDCNIE